MTRSSTADRQRSRRDAGHDRGRAVRPVRVSLRHRLRRRAVLEGRGRGHRRRRVQLAEGDRPPRRLLRVPRADRRHRNGRGVPGRMRDRGRDLTRRAADPRRAGDGSRTCRGAGKRRAVAGAARAPRHQRAGVAPSASTRSPARSAFRRTSTGSAGGATAPRPATTTGTILLAGHVDSAKEGAGAFYALKYARRGDVIRRRRAALPRHVGAPRPQAGAAVEHLHADGPARLVLVTCGGPFDGRATTATTSSSRPRRVDACSPASRAGRPRSTRAPTWRRRRSSAATCGSAPDARILFGAVLTAEDGSIEIGARCVVMENALIRGRAQHPARIGDDVLIGPHAHVNGAHDRGRLLHRHRRRAVPGRRRRRRHRGPDPRRRAGQHGAAAGLARSRSAGSRSATRRRSSRRTATTTSGRSSASSTSPARSTASRAAPTRRR